MLGSQQLVPRTRRPYDLRRKVLLKNFLKEQLTYIPSARDKSLDRSTEESSTDSSPSGNEENLVQINEVQDSSVSSTTETPLVPSAPSTSNEKENDEATDNPVEETDKNCKSSESGTSLFPKLTKLANALRLGVSNKKNRVEKSKQTFKTFKINKPILRNSNVSKAEDSLKDRKKSLFDIFKSKRESKRNKPIRLKKTSSDDDPPPTSKSDNTNTSNQSVQTDISWSHETLQNIQQSNKCLIEENRLLSESLSNIMTGINFTLEKCGKKSSVCTDLYTSDNARPHSNLTDYSQTPQHPNQSNAKILRSKSIQERNQSRNRTLPLRSRSLNRGPVNRSSFYNNRFHNGQSNVLPNLRPAVSAFQHSDHRTMQTLPIHPHSRPLLRRVSMPERPPRRSEHLRLRPRSNSIRATDSSVYKSNRTGSRLVNYPYRSRSRQESSYSHHVPFKNMPPDVFY